MFMLARFCEAAAVVVDKALWLYSLVVLVAVLITWVSPDPFNPLVRILRQSTEPVFNWVRRRLPFVMVGMIDLSPMLVLLGLWFARMFVVGTLLDLSMRLR